MSDMPRHLIFEITRRCNYSCPFCYCVWHEFPELAKRDLPMAQWRQIIRMTLENGVDDILFTGGEALLRADTPELIAYARSLSPTCQLSLFTNGSRMTEALLKSFRKLRVRLCTSLPGLKTYAAMTGTRRSYTRTLELLARAKELRWPLEVSLTATAVNCHEFVEMFCAAALSGAAAIQAGAVMVEGKARHRSDLALSRKTWEELKTAIRTLPDCGTRYSFCDEMICNCRPQPADYLDVFGLPNQTPCPAGRDFGVIGPSGYFRFCMHTVENLCFWRDLPSCHREIAT